MSPAIFMLAENELNSQQLMKQPDLFPLNAYLERKLSRQIFPEVPNAPGVYRFYDKDDELIYVGKSKNLRKRLNSYKRVKTNSAGKKLSALVSKISVITFEVFTTEIEALLEENRLIRTYRPLFNHVNKQIETYYFIRIMALQGGIFFTLSMSAATDLKKGLKKNHLFTDDEGRYSSGFDIISEPSYEKVYGCFKGHVTVRKSFGALLQLLCMQFTGKVNPHCLPHVLTRNLAPLAYFLPVYSVAEVKVLRFIELLDEWFTGQSDEILNLFESMALRTETSFECAYIKDRIEVLQSFYDGTLQKQRLIRNTFVLTADELIKQDELDDFQVKLRAK